MKKLTLLLVFGFLFNFAFVQAQQTDVTQLTAEFDKMMSEQYKSDEPGATALISRKGEVIFKKAYGMADIDAKKPMQIDNVFRIGSITKQFTAVAILQLMEQGKLSLQDEITKFIPDYPTQGHKITVEHLLTHTSGIQSYTGMKDYVQTMAVDMKPTEMIDRFKNEPMNFAPGTKWNYNNSGYFLLGYIIEKVSGKTYGEYLNENFFKILGMRNSQYGTDTKLASKRVVPYSRGMSGFETAQPLSMTQPYAAGSIESTVEDLIIWHHAVHSNILVKKETIEKAFKKYKLADGKETDYGYGWRLGYVQESPTIEHGGGINGTLTMAIYLPKEDVFVAIFSNCDCNPPEDLTAKLAALTIGKPYQPKEIPLKNDVLKEYLGVYENEKGEQRVISLSENQLFSQRGRNPKFAVKHFQKDKFFFEKALQTMDFSRNAKGEITGLTTHSRNGNEVWTRTDKPIAMQTEIKVAENILATYVGEYEITPTFSFAITKEQERLFLQATGQEKVEIFAEAENRFFLKVNDAQLRFLKDDAGKITKAVLKQSGREIEAKKIK
jgi:CubicO group peptidase (beta-lactamase class C family)